MCECMPEGCFITLGSDDRLSDFASIPSILVVPCVLSLELVMLGCFACHASLLVDCLGSRFSKMLDSESADSETGKSVAVHQVLFSSFCHGFDTVPTIEPSEYHLQARDFEPS